jgi:acetoin utilization deacetylase AcuC-like enzyme
VFNDIAVAAAVALRTYGEAAVAPVLILDLDVHQGNGTASIFQKDKRVVKSRNLQTLNLQTLNLNTKINK